MQTLLALDQTLFLFLNHLPHDEFLNTLALVLSGVGTAGLVWFVIGAWLFLREEKKDRWFFAPLLSAGTASWLLVEKVLKPWIARSRPGLEAGAIVLGDGGNGYSFPSGHATIAWAMAVVLSRKEPKWRWIFYLLAILISFSRIYIGKHFPLDVVAGGLLGWGIGKALTISSLSAYANTIMKRIIPLLIIFLLASSIALVAPVVRAQTLLFDEDGILYIEDGEVLGEKTEEPERKENKLPETSTRENKEAGETARVKQRLAGPSGVRSIEVKDGKLEVEFERKERKELKEGDKIQEEKTAVTSIRVRERSDAHEVEIKAGKDGMELEQRSVRAKTTVPISIGEHNELMVKTQAGEKEVGVLPDAAVQKLLEQGIFSKTQTAVGTGETQTKQEVTLTEKNGMVEYTVKGQKEEKFLGLFPVTAQVEARISAETGAVTSVSRPWYQSAFGFLFR